MLGIYHLRVRGVVFLIVRQLLYVFTERDIITKRVIYHYY